MPESTPFTAIGLFIHSFWLVCRNQPIDIRGWLEFMVRKCFHVDLKSNTIKDYLQKLPHNVSYVISTTLLGTKHGVLGNT
jgi:hypothetical protein